MASLMITRIWIPVLAACVAAGGVSSIRGQSSTDFDWDFVPPSPAPVPQFTVPAATAVPSGSSASNATEPVNSFHSKAFVRNTSVPGVALPPWGAEQSQAASDFAAGHIGAKKPLTSAAGTTASRRAPGPASTPAYSKVTPTGQVATRGKAMTVSHEVTEAGLPPAGTAVPFVPTRNSAVSTPPSSFPTERGTPPSVIGSHLGLKPGETATERSLRLMSVIGDLQRHVEDVTRLNANLNLHVNQRDEKLQLAVREIRSARQDLATAREELERLKREVDELRQKVRNAEKDNAAVLHSMAPLLQQLLESDDVGSLPTKPAE